MAGASNKGLVDPMDDVLPKAPARKVVVPNQGISYGEPVYDEEGRKVEQTTKFRGRDVKCHAHDIKHARADVRVELPAALADELLKSGLAREPDGVTDFGTVEELARVREAAANNVATVI